MKNKLLSLFFYLFLFLTNTLFAQEFKGIIEFTSQDRILILSPHPDDEAIGTGGVIQKALKKGAEVKIVIFTNGEHNELAFIVYKKRVILKKKEFILLGEMRRKETIQAMELLGLPKENIIFLGYPDAGTMAIFTKYWQDMPPYRSLLTHITNVPYPECLSYNAPYKGESILKDLEKIILDFKPTKIFVSHPIDTNKDHRSLYLFLQVALWNLEGKIEKPAIYPYLIHVVGWPKPRGYHPELELLPPKRLENSGISWYRVDLSEEEVRKKYEAILLYKSQVKPYPIYLPTFARKNEFFGDYPVIKLLREKEKVYWYDSIYGCDAENLFIKLHLKRRIAKDLGINIYIFGYNKDVEFAKMPKFRLSINISGLHIKEKKQTLFIKEIDLNYENKGKTILLKIPFSILGNPNYILTSISSRAISFKETAWRLIDIE